VARHRDLRKRHHLERVLYVSALCAAQAGVLAPLVLLLVAGVLYLYQKVYAEVGSALPLNGGTYTVLPNTTNKRVAAGAACLTLLSYIATAVISANEAMHYAVNLWTGLDVFAATVGVLAVFAFLGILGISESAVMVGARRFSAAREAKRESLDAPLRSAPAHVRERSVPRAPQRHAP
jgi:hypothetical protein